MDWITGMQKAIGYIEDHIFDELDYEQISAQAYVSSFHFQRVFSIMCGFTLGEYIRNRRLTLAGNELTTGKIKVIDAAIKYGYESPDSFAKAFTRFHGITPSAAREPGVSLKSFSRLLLKIVWEGGTIMNYRIEKKPAMIFTGYKRHYEGAPGAESRFDAECDFFVHTRANQYLLQGMAENPEIGYCIIKNIDDEGYDFYIANLLPQYMREHITEDCVLGAEDAKRFENIEIADQTYAVFETERCQYPSRVHSDLHRKIAVEWLPSSDYILADAPEITVIHWFRKPKNEQRYIEFWIPVEKK